MPITAHLVDELRRVFGTPYADALLLKAKQGKGGFYAAEISPVDGRLVEFGSTRRFGGAPDGRRATIVDGKLVMPDERKRDGA